MAALEVSALEAGYGPLQILFGVSLRVERGEQVLVFGPNGAGKSTLMKALTGFARVTGGSARLRGRELLGLEPEAVVRLGLGYVPQLENVFASLSVAENLELGALLASNKAKRIAAMYELFPVLHTKRRAAARTLSGGQRQMLAMARAIVSKPEVLLLDEPTAGLAPKLVEEMFATIRRIGQTGVSVLMVEQNAKQALRFADRGYVLESGRVRFEGEAETLLAREDIGALYLGGNPVANEG